MSAILNNAPARAVLYNRFLANMPLAERQALAAHMWTEEFAVGTVLYRPGETMHTIYFPNDCLVSLMKEVEGQHALEIALVGGEGMLGYSGTVGQTQSPVRAVLQQAGSINCVSAEHFCMVCDTHHLVQNMCLLYSETLFAEAVQIAVCSHFHLLEARLARSLLTIRERLQSDNFHITHEFLAHALGVRRVGVTKAASSLQKQELIAYSRGKVTVLDPPGLALVSCACFQQIVGHVPSEFTPSLK
ncbi:Crp/Fnr family transcriptional regulator [Undibacterium sp. TJN19]|uniref:Crp/Fnr family transcriptional regulator n=1 Tax=Undibacterium sp. TJN19 TaxID=3413055 RepID=UPI003BF243BA